MKKLFTLMVLTTIAVAAFAQSPQKMSYQCVVRNSSGALLANQAVGMKISILKGSATGTVVFSETYSPIPQTNANGLVTVEIGVGTATVGTFSSIDWASGPYFLKTETDPAGGTNYTISGTSQLLSVPYALYAKSAANGFSGSYNDLTNKPALFDGTWTSLTGKPAFANVATTGSYNDLLNKPTLFDGTWNSLTGKPAGFADGIDNVDDADNSITNEIQTLSISGTVLSLSSGGGSITLPSSGIGDNWGTQTVISNSTLTGSGTIANPLAVSNTVITPLWTNIQSIPAGFTDGIDNVDDADNSITNEIQALSISGTTLSLSYGGGSVSIPGDNWGTQSVTANATLTGNGTAANPLGIADNAVTSAKILDNTIMTADLANDAVTSAKISDGAIASVDIADNAISSSKILDAAVGTAEMANSAITTVKIADNAVTIAKLPAGAASDNYLRGDGTWAIPSSGSGAAWNLLGNAGTLPETNFIGTTDNVPLKFRVNDTLSGIIDPSNENTGFGKQAVAMVTTGQYNSAFGSLALGNVSSGLYNTAAGSGALYSNTTGYSNSALGIRALYNNTNRSNLVAIGDSALYNNGTGVTGYWEAISNTAIGSKSMYSNTTGHDNTAVGFHSLYSNTTGFYNIAMGSNGLSGNTKGYNNIAVGVYCLWYNTIGSGNTAVGGHSMFYNSTGTSNIAIGNNALHNNSVRSNLVAVGDSALYNNGTGAPSGPYAKEASRNTAVGSKASYSNTTGYYNTSLGFQALYGNSQGYANTALGVQAMYNSSQAANNTAGGYQSMYYSHNGLNNVSYGYQSLYSNTDGNNNTAIGAYALYSNKANSRSVAIGFNAMYYADDRITGRETFNIGIGYEALRGNGTASLNTGQNNIAVGDQALRANSSGSSNTGIGNQALYLNSGGNYNVATGYQALYNNNSGYENNAFGVMALYNNTSGYCNTAIGRQSLNSNQTGNFNVAIGHLSSYANTNTSYNTCVGVQAGDIYTYSSGTFLGALAYPTANGFSNCMALGYEARVNGSNRVVIGNSSVTSIGGYTSWSNFSDGRFKKNVREDVPGLAFINQLRPVTYTLDIQSLNADQEKNRPSEVRDGEIKHERTSQELESITEKGKIIYTGFVAQEVEAAASSIGYDFSGVDAPGTADGYYNLRYADFVAPLVKAVQEQQQQIEGLQRQIDELKQLVNNLLQK